MRAKPLGPRVGPGKPFEQQVLGLETNITQVLEHLATLQTTYFARRERWLDELAFETDWRAFFRHAVLLGSDLEVAVSELMKNAPELDQFKLFTVQTAHYQRWVGRLSRAYSFTRVAALVDELTPHDPLAGDLHPKLCCAVPILTRAHNPLGTSSER